MAFPDHHRVPLARTAGVDPQVDRLVPRDGQVDRHFRGLEPFDLRGDLRAALLRQVVARLDALQPIVDAAERLVAESDHVRVPAHTFRQGEAPR